MSTEYNPLPITQQPKPATMDATIKSEKAPRCCHGHVAFVSNSATDRPDNSCFRRLIWPTSMAAFVLLAGLSALSLSQGYLNLSDLELDDLLPRATSSTSSGSPFVKNKLYLVVLFVGLLVVIGLGIALTFWCCRGSFRNPLCCPCYLCACCGGLACLECIGCGLCVEAAEEV